MSIVPNSEARCHSTGRPWNGGITFLECKQGHSARDRRDCGRCRYLSVALETFICSEWAG
eukprot:scaffold16355_cov170-Amphora_coffeaeformis.AAC.7